MNITVTAGDGSLHTFPAGTQSNVIANTLARYNSGSSAGAPALAPAPAAPPALNSASPTPQQLVAMYRLARATNPDNVGTQMAMSRAMNPAMSNGWNAATGSQSAGPMPQGLLGPVGAAAPGTVGVLATDVGPATADPAMQQMPTTSDKGTAFIKTLENYNGKTYVGEDNLNRTIGWGHKVTPDDGDLIQQLNATDDAQQKQRLLQAVFDDDVGKAESAVRDLIPGAASLSPNQFDALVSFTLNAGPGGLQQSQLRTDVNNGDYDAAAQDFGHYVYVKQKDQKSGKRVTVYSQGLANRRNAESALFANGDYGKPAYTY